MTNDGDFDPTESIEESNDSDTGEFLNRKTGEYAPQAVVYSIIVAFIGIGFAIGYALTSGATSGVLCLFETMAMFTGDPTALGGSDDIMEQAQNQLTTCTTSNLFTPLPIITGLVGGAIGAYPAYKVAKLVSKGKQLRSLV